MTFRGRIVYGLTVTTQVGRGEHIDKDIDKSPYHLFCKHANSLDGKLATTHVKEILEVGTQ